ncbi:MAG: amidase family protein, partial [Quisquiliibacterium sp.]
LTPCDQGARIGWLGNLNGYLPMQEGILELCRQALERLQDAGCGIQEAQLGFEPERLWKLWLTMRSSLVGGARRADYDDPTRRALLKPEAIWEVQNSLESSALDLYRASAERSAWYQHLLGLFERYDYLALPTAQVFPFPVEQHWPGQIAGKPMDTYHRWMEVVIGPTLAGLPVISVPVGFSATGLPMGMQLIGRPRGDLQVLRLALTYEQASDWLQRKPPSI